MNEREEERLRRDVETFEKTEAARKATHVASDTSNFNQPSKICSEPN